MIDKPTDELLKMLKNINNESELKKYISNMDISLSLSEYFEYMLQEKKLEKSDIIREADIHRNYGYQIFSGEKNPGRDKVIALCIAMHLNLLETQRALTIGGHNILYAKNSRDSIIIFALNNGYSIMDTNELLDEENEPPLK